MMIMMKKKKKGKVHPRYSKACENTHAKDNKDIIRWQQERLKTQSINLQVLESSNHIQMVQTFYE